MTTWKLKLFSELSTIELYELIRLRVNVFVVEQNCPYPELDGKDSMPDVYHLLGYQGSELIACARLIPQGISYPSASIGRVATKLSHRGGGLGHQLLTQALTCIESLWPQSTIEIGAQAHLEHYYGRHGFVINSKEYLEDGIPHIDMLRTPSQ
ncbi:GNAT family N-acetyltransferase [Vibrio sp. ZSDZ34]|jgi:ElaA protein|uniref:Protein ElaA n=1 Tax=Vibrio gelatinilyticus TaxID=2893468 RepID=A0A9X1WDX9_9VIBR|nr:GNAT family N-acetyltransferase [Vibrio gelatinilyticus]MCJ2378291.1 GNAT family N-acetyltransferase [Vibrio gelatinilyticus]